MGLVLALSSAPHRVLLRCSPLGLDLLLHPQALRLLPCRCILLQLHELRVALQEARTWVQQGVGGPGGRRSTWYMGRSSRCATVA